MSFNNLARVYGTMARIIKTWLKGLNACESTVSPELVKWASELLTAPIDTVFPPWDWKHPIKKLTCNIIITIKINLLYNFN